MTDARVESRGAEITPEEVWAFWRHMQERFRTKVVRKGDALEMRLVARALAALGIQRKDQFLENFTTTIGRRIYTPFEIGVATSAGELWHQVVLCVHEHQHVVQHDREGLRFEVSYLGSRAARARWEAEAYRSNLELHFWRFGTTPPAREVVDVLRHYGCRSEDIDVAAQSLALSAVSVQKGAVINEATHVALGWLNEHVPHLRTQPVA